MILDQNNRIEIFHHETYYGWVIVIIASVCMMFSYGARYAFSVFFKPMSGDFGWSRAMTSGVFSLYMITYAFGSVVTGRVVDKYGPKLLIIFGALFLGGGIYACSTVSQVYQLYIFYGILVGIGSAATGWVNATSTIARWFVTKRGLATGITSTGVGLGSALIIPLATMMVASAGWRASYQMFGIAIMVALIPLGFFSIKAPLHQNTQKVQSESLKSKKFSILDAKYSVNLQQATKTLSYWVMFFTQWLMAFQLNVIMVHFIPYATDLGMTPMVASRDIALLSMVSILGRMYGGWFSDKVGRKKIVAAAMFTQAISCFFLLFIRQYIFLYLFIYLYGISYGAWASQSAPLAADIFGNKHFGTIWGVITLAIGFGGAIGPFLAGWVHDLTGSYQMMFTINVLINFSSFILLILFVKPLILKNQDA